MKKWTALLLAVVMVFALTACGSSNANTPTQAPATNPPASSSSTATDTPAVAEPEPEPEEDIAAMPEKDLGGRVFKVASWWEGLVTETNDPEPDATNANYEEALLKWNVVQEYSRANNCTIEEIVVGWDDYVSTFTTSVMAGDPFADAVLLSDQWMVPIFQNNQVLPLEEWCPPDSDAMTSQRWVKKGLEFGGSSYYLIGYDLPQGGSLLGVNLDIINAIGAENPVDLYNSGQWTWDKLLEISKLATRATGSDGVIDQWGISVYANNLLTMAVASNDGYLVGLNGENGLTDPKTQRAIEFFNQLYVVDQVAYKAPGVEWWDWGTHVDKFRQGGVAFFWYIDWMQAADALAYNWAVVPFPKGPDNTANIEKSWFKGLEQAICIPRGTKDPYDVYDMLYKCVYNYFGEDGSLKEDSCMNWFQTSCFTNQEDIDVNIAVSGNGYKYDLNSSVQGYDLGGWFIGPLLNGEMTPAQAIETNIQPAADAISNLFK